MCTQFKQLISCVVIGSCNIWVKIWSIQSFPCVGLTWMIIFWLAIQIMVMVQHEAEETHTPVPDECPHRHIEYSEQFLQCQSWRNCLNLSVPSHIWNIISVHLDEGNTLDYNELQPGSLRLLSMSNLTLLALLQWCVLCKLDFWGQIKHAKTVVSWDTLVVARLT